MADVKGFCVLNESHECWIVLGFSTHCLGIVSDEVLSLLLLLLLLLQPNVCVQYLMFSGIKGCLYVFFVSCSVKELRGEMFATKVFLVTHCKVNFRPFEARRAKSSDAANFVNT